MQNSSNLSSIPSVPINLPRPSEAKTEAEANPIIHQSINPPAPQPADASLATGINDPLKMNTSPLTDPPTHSFTNSAAPTCPATGSSPSCPSSESAPSGKPSQPRSSIEHPVTSIENPSSRTHKSMNLRLGLLPRRKIAHLPEKIRNSVNVMIRDDIPLREICSHFRDVGPVINKDNLLRWKRTGYRQWLKEEIRREDAHAKIRFLLGLVQEKKNCKILRATQQIAALQVADILTTLDHQSLRKSIQDDPAQYTRLLNALPRLAEAGLACERLAAQASDPHKFQPGQRRALTAEELHEIETQIGLL